MKTRDEILIILHIIAGRAFEYALENNKENPIDGLDYIGIAILDYIKEFDCREAIRDGLDDLVSGDFYRNHKKQDTTDVELHNQIVFLGNLITYSYDRLNLPDCITKKDYYLMYYILHSMMFDEDDISKEMILRIYNDDFRKVQSLLSQY